MRRPVIGITAGRLPQSMDPSILMQLQSDTYVQAVLRAGGIPILLPAVVDEEGQEEILRRVDGVLFAGGDDLDPGLYGQEVHESVQFDSVRDASELGYMRRMLEGGKPLLCICRGMQLLNVLQGGSLVQDIPSMMPGAAVHRGGSGNLAHVYSLVEGGMLQGILGVLEVQTNAYHHQAVEKVGEGLVVDAYAEDGVVEGVYLPGEQWVVGVQCHPESLEVLEPTWEKLFSAFVQKAAAI